MELMHRIFNINLAKIFYKSAKTKRQNLTPKLPFITAAINVKAMSIVNFRSA